MRNTYRQMFHIVIFLLSYNPSQKQRYLLKKLIIKKKQEWIFDSLSIIIIMKSYAQIEDAQQPHI